MIVYETDDGCIGVSAIDPDVLLSVVDTPDLAPIADGVSEWLDAVIAGLPEATAS